MGFIWPTILEGWQRWQVNPAASRKDLSHTLPETGSSTPSLIIKDVLSTSAEQGCRRSGPTTEQTEAHTLPPYTLPLIIPILPPSQTGEPMGAMCPQLESLQKGDLTGLLPAPAVGR